MNPSTRDIVVLALSGRAGSDQDEEARAAGCDGYITKPVDSATLLSSIREHLDRHAQAPDEASPGVEGHPISAGEGPADEPDLESLKRSFIEEGALQSRQMVEALDGSFDASKTARLCHQWVGAAGILGYLAISERARAVEEALLGPRVEAWRIRELLSNLVLAFGESRENSKPSIAEPVAQAL
jgi:hypothetical protein